MACSFVYVHGIPIVFALKRGLPHGILVLLITFPIIVCVINVKNHFYFAYNDIFQIYTLIVISAFKLDVVSSTPNHIESLNSQKLEI